MANLIWTFHLDLVKICATEEYATKYGEKQKQGVNYQCYYVVYIHDYKYDLCCKCNEVYPLKEANAVKDSCKYDGYYDEDN